MNSAASKLIPIFYDELRRLAAAYMPRDRPDSPPRLRCCAKTGSGTQTRIESGRRFVFSGQNPNLQLTSHAS